MGHALGHRLRFDGLCSITLPEKIIMGWGSGSTLMSRIISDFQKQGIDPETRKRVYKILIPAFEAQDWDTQDDCWDEDPVFDQVLETLREEEVALD